MPELSEHARRAGATARLLLLALALVWGVNWPMKKIVLADVNPWTFRTLGLALGAGALLVLLFPRRRSLMIASGRARLHVIVAGLFNIGGFSVFSALALREAASSRVAILVYTMPIWTTLFARLLLGEALTPRRLAALCFCAAGLAVLLVPHLPLPAGLWYALATAWSWAAGTLYMKWAQVEADTMTITVWQILAGLGLVAAVTAALGEPWYVWPIPAVTLAAWVYGALAGIALAYCMWFTIVERLPASTASLASLMTPAIGVLSSVLLLGEQPTAHDIVGFALVFVAAACVMLQPERALAPAGDAAGR